MRNVWIYLLGITVLTVGCTAVSQPSSYVQAGLYYRYDAATTMYTAEASLTRKDSVRGVDTAYVSPGGVSFVGSNLPLDIAAPKATRYRGTRKTEQTTPRFVVSGIEGVQHEVLGNTQLLAGLIVPDTLDRVAGIQLQLTEPLLQTEKLSLLYEPEAGDVVLATIPGPTAAPGALVPSERMADWPLGSGKLTVIRIRNIVLKQPGLLGALSEESYSIPVAVVVR